MMDRISKTSEIHELSTKYLQNVKRRIFEYLRSSDKCNRIICVHYYVVAGGYY